MKIDGVELSTGDRILFTVQVSWRRRIWNWLTRKPAMPPENGVYIVSQGGWKKS